MKAREGVRAILVRLAGVLAVCGMSSCTTSSCVARCDASATRATSKRRRRSRTYARPQRSRRHRDDARQREASRGSHRQGGRALRAAARSVACRLHKRRRDPQNAAGAHVLVRPWSERKQRPPTPVHVGQRVQEVFQGAHRARAYPSRPATAGSVRCGHRRACGVEPAPSAGVFVGTVAGRAVGSARTSVWQSARGAKPLATRAKGSMLQGWPRGTRASRRRRPRWRPRRTYASTSSAKRSRSTSTSRRTCAGSRPGRASPGRAHAEADGPLLRGPGTRAHQAGRSGGGRARADRRRPRERGRAARRLRHRGRDPAHAPRVRPPRRRAQPLGVVRAHARRGRHPQREQRATGADRPVRRRGVRRQRRTPPASRRPRDCADVRQRHSLRPAALAAALELAVTPGNSRSSRCSAEELRARRGGTASA